MFEQIVSSNNTMGQTDILSLSSLKDTYKQIASAPERNETEHPYEFITQVYGFHSIAARATGLPGFSPPSYVSLAYLIQRLITVTLITSLLLLGVGGIVLLVGGITNIQFTLALPFTGWVVYELSSVTIIATPLFLVGSMYVCSSIGFIWSKQLAQRLSEPYESEYESWLDDLKPPDNGFPAGLAEVYYNDEHTEPRSELQVENIPKAAPPAFRQPTVYERVVFILWTIVYVFLWFFLHPMRLQNEVMYDQMNTITDEVTESKKVQQRTDKYTN